MAALEAAFAALGATSATSALSGERIREALMTHGEAMAPSELAEAFRLLGVGEGSEDAQDSPPQRRSRASLPAELTAHTFAADVLGLEAAA